MFIKNHIKLLCVGLLLFSVALISAQTKSSDVQTISGKKFYIHKIEKSQSLYAISKLYQVSLEDIYTHNPEVKSGAKAGQAIKIPFSPTPTSAVVQVSPNSATSITPIDTTKFITHKVLKGETTYSLLKKFNLSEKQLQSFNPQLIAGLKEGDLIIIGEKNKHKPVVHKESVAHKETAHAKENKQQLFVKEKTNPSVVDSSALKPILKEKKSSYRVALILPFRLENIVNTEMSELAKNQSPFPTVSALALDFYLGFKNASDSLTEAGFEVNIDTYDIDDKDSLKIVQLTQDNTLKNYDLIFGPLHASSFKTISKKAKEFHVPIVSPITQQNKILYNNVYTSKTNPSQFTLIESLADYCIDSLKKQNANIFLMAAFEKDKREIQFINAFKKYYNERMVSLGKIKDTLSITKDINAVKNNYSPTTKNVVITFSENEVFIVDFSRQLAIFADKKDIVLAGWQTISEMDNIDQEYLNQLQYTFPHQFNVIDTAAYKSAIQTYQLKQETFPSENFFMGYDVATYYLKQLKEQGPNFIYKLNAFPMDLNYMRFKYSRPDNATGFDNRGAFIFRYNNYRLQKTGWK